MDGTYDIEGGGQRVRVKIAVYAYHVRHSNTKYQKRQPLIPGPNLGDDGRKFTSNIT